MRRRAWCPASPSSRIVGAAWCGEDGYFDRPQSVVEAFARGTDVRIADVRTLEREAGSWRLALGDGGRLTAPHVVVAAAVETASLLQPLGVDLPIAGEERFLFLSRPLRERLLEPLVVATERQFAAKQLADGRVLASDLSAAGDPARGKRGGAPRSASPSASCCGARVVDFPLLDTRHLRHDA